MKHIFYFLTILPLLWEFINITNVKETHRFTKTIKQLKGKPFDDYSSNQKNYSFLVLGYIFWTLIGLFSSQWIVFLTLLVLAFIPKKWIAIRFIDSLISFWLLLFVILNVYHFKIDTFQFVLNYIK